MAKQTATEEKRWYVIHTYSGYEESVVKNLKQRAESFGMENKIFEVIVPREKKIRIKNGKRKEIEEKLYPGYVLVEMIVTDESWYVVRNTPNVTGFVGAGVTPVPLSQKEVDVLMGRIKKEISEVEMNIEEGDAVKIIDGPFKDFDGKVSQVDKERGKLKVLINMFGRDTSVELDFLQIKKI
ncbi:MAG: transcription termination/antitermination protein NusG [Patescibacteria group bacterium]|nr:transcription termination/antitermination protein NusG [Patescibacteria group bacterium]